MAADSLQSQEDQLQGSGKAGLSAHTQYYRARLLYQAGQLPEAMQLARSAVVELDRAPGLIAEPVLIQCLHLLSELHYDHAAYADSIGYYQRRAALLITSQTALPIRVEQLLCVALSQQYYYTFTTQVTAARLGKDMLGKYRGWYPDRFARLLVAEAVGLKKYADLQPEGVRNPLLKQAINVLTEAVAVFRQQGSIRWREAQREKVIIVCRFRDRVRFAREVAPLETNRGPDFGRSDIAAPATLSPFGFPDRLRGYFHFQSGAPDSALYYYRKFQPQAPLFDFHLTDETYWMLIQYGIQTGDLRRAERSARDQLTLYRCCGAQERELPLRDLLPRLPPTFLCSYALTDLGRIRLADHRLTGRMDALQEATFIFDHILAGWERLFLTGEEEGAVTQLKNITHKIVQHANEAAWLAYFGDPSAPRADKLLWTLERTKSFLLLSSRLTEHTKHPSSIQVDSLLHWQSTINLLKEREMWGNLSSADRRRLIDLSQRHRKEVKRIRGTHKGVEYDPTPAVRSVDKVRAMLTDSSAVLVFAEGDGQLVAQYIDQDTTIAYCTPPLENLQKDINQLLGLLERQQGEDKLKQYRGVSFRLYRDVLGPLRKALGQRAELTIIPAGPLRQLPFAALLTDSAEGSAWGDLPYLVHALTLSYAPSLRIEQLNRSQRDGGEKFVGAKVGSWVHPQLTAYFTPAQQFLYEHSANGSANFTLSTCSAATFARHLNGFDIVNLAVHAKGDPFSAHRNYLHFASGDSLNGAAIGQLHCSARLVVLVGCETGLGRATVGEGTFSIARSFQQLGVPDVVYSLWRIPAAASAELQRRFYVHLYGGASPARALTLAQRELAKHGGRYTFAGSWAGMVKG